jgi:hypothetical protein
VAALDLESGITMKSPSPGILRSLIALLAWSGVVGAQAADIGQIKTSKGQVVVQRSGADLPGEVGLRLLTDDTIKTGPDGAAGVTMRDDSLLSVGPNSILSLERFDFDGTTQQGRFDTRLQRGTLAIISGRIAKQSPQSMTVRTPSAQLGVRGTNFVVSADD